MKQSDCNRRLRKILIRLRNNCKKIAVILRTGGRCCRQEGCICQIQGNAVSLVTDNCSQIYIPFGCICAVMELEDDQDQEEGKCQTKDDHQQELVNQDNNQVYGYGRKIKIQFTNQNSEVEIKEVAAVELSINIAAHRTRNLIQYFQRSPADERNIGISVLPSGPGRVDEIEVDSSDNSAVITGRGLVYIDSDPKSETEFELLVTTKEASIEFEYQQEQFQFGPQQLVGIGNQQPITIK